MPQSKGSLLEQSIWLQQILWGGAISYATTSFRCHCKIIMKLLKNVIILQSYSIAWLEIFILSFSIAKEKCSSSESWISFPHSLANVQNQKVILLGIRFWSRKISQDLDALSQDGKSNAQKTQFNAISLFQTTPRKKEKNEEPPQM